MNLFKHQGVLASAMSLASIVGPLEISSFYFVVRDLSPGDLAAGAGRQRDCGTSRFGLRFLGFSAVSNVGDEGMRKPILNNDPKQVPPG